MNVNLRAMIIVVGCGLAACTTQEVTPDGGGGGTGNAGSGGSTGTGGAAQGNPGVLCLPPDQKLTDFTYDADAGGTDQVRFGTRNFQPEAADADLKRGHYRGPLHGLPWGAKDLFATKGIKTT